MTRKRNLTLIGVGILVGTLGAFATAAAQAPVAPLEPEAEPPAVEAAPVTPEPAQGAPTPPEAGVPVEVEPPPEATPIPETAPEPEVEPAPEITNPDALYPGDTTPDVANPETDLPDWAALLREDGYTVGDAIVCPPYQEVTVGHYPDGATWASCQ